MNILDSVILGVLQGITEFLPVSSSGHLVLGEELLGLNVWTLKSFDVTVHLATFLAILVYFWKDVWGMFMALGRFVVGKLKRGDEYGKLILYIVIGTVPAVVVGLFGEEWIDGIFRNVVAVGVMMLIVGVVFMLGEGVYQRVGNRGMKWWKAIVIGCAQAVALVPGVSRSGSTIVAGLFQGVKREEAARFSFLLGLPAMLGAGILTFVSGGEMASVEVLPLVLGFVSAFVFGVLSISFLMMFLKRHRLTVFAIYLIALGIGVLV
ncbi:MAG: undecaprenyl-diphosphatase UppP [Candidatus Peregrinibacteria bacterium]